MPTGSNQQITLPTNGAYSDIRVPRFQLEQLSNIPQKRYNTEITYCDHLKYSQNNYQMGINNLPTFYFPFCRRASHDTATWHGSTTRSSFLSRGHF